MRIAICDDETLFLSQLKSKIYEYSNNHNLEPVVDEYTVGSNLINSNIKYDIIILDLMLPKMDGYQVIKKLKDEKVYTPILILSAKSELDDKVKGFEVGADDYLTKPFEIKELIMRVNAIVKRNYNLQSQNLTCNNMSLDLKGCKMINTDTGKSIRISGKELQLLEMLLYNQRQVLTKEQITEKIWGYESNAEYNNVEVYVSFIRRKLKQLNCNVTINSVRGVGYSLEG